MGLLVGGFVFAEEEPIDYFAISLEELMQIPIVESASRQAEPWHLTSVPVSIITAEDIHYSGLTRLGEILQFAPGVDYVKIDNNREMIGIRGMTDVYSDKTLLLIDGRSAENHIFGGFELRRLPILVEDIERIEVVRGPASAAWGANAVNGVINIITKDPKDTLGFASSVTMDEEGNSYSFARWGEQDGNLSYRLSVGYSEGKASGGSEWDQALLIPTKARDFYRDSVLDTLFVYEPSDETKISFGLSHSRREEGDFNFIYYQPMKNAELNTTRSFLRLDQEIDEKQSFSLQWAEREDETRYPSAIKATSHENDFEVQYTHEDENNKLTLGANTRFIRINSERMDPNNFIDLTKEPYDENWIGLFLVDRWQMLDRFAVEGQLRGDCYNQTGKDWSGRLTGLLSLDDEDHHVVRLSVARAFRAPSAVWRDLHMQRFLVGNVMVPSGGLENEHITSYELGYTALFPAGCTFRFNVYYQKYEDMLMAAYLAPPAPIPQRVENAAKATAQGGEVEFEVKGSWGRVSLWSSYQELEWEGLERGDSFAADPARVKAGMTGRLNLSADCVLTLHYKYSKKNTTDSPTNARMWPEVHRLDTALSKTFFDDNVELLFGVTDIFDNTGDPQNDIYIGTPSHETQGRTFFVRAGINF